MSRQKKNTGNQLYLYSDVKFTIIILNEPIFFVFSFGNIVVISYRKNNLFIYVG